MKLKPTKKQIVIGVGYVVFMLLFFFLGIPKISILDGFIGAVIVSAVYALIVYVILKMKKG